MTEQEKREKVIKGLERIRDYDPMFRVTHDDEFSQYAADALALLKAQENEIEDLKQEIEGHKDNLRETLDEMMRYADELKAQEPREPHYTKLEYIVNGMPVAINHPECPRCYDNGLVLWDAEIEKGAAYCKRCGQAVKWE